MKFSTGQRGRSRLQGHRKRRRIITIVNHPPKQRLSTTEYKTIKQYQSMGGMLDVFKQYGFRGGIENLKSAGASSASDNGHEWLGEEPMP